MQYTWAREGEKIVILDGGLDLRVRKTREMVM